MRLRPAVLLTKVLIIGTGDAGTRLLQQLLAELGLPEGGAQARESWRFEHYEVGPEGIGIRLLDPLDEAPTREPLDEDGQFELSLRWQESLQALVRCEVPFTLLEYPRFVEDRAYAFQRLSPLLAGRERAEFDAAHGRVAERFPVEALAGHYVVIARGTPELAEAVDRRRRRRQRLQRAALGLLAAFCVGLGLYRLSQNTVPACTSKPAAESVVGGNR